MITVNCAQCDKSMVLDVGSMAYITPVGLVQNLCDDRCMQEYNKSDFVLKLAAKGYRTEAVER